MEKISESVVTSRNYCITDKEFIKGSGKRLMRKTKEEMISIIGQCFGIVIAYLDLRQSYDYLKATFDILRDDNLSILKMIKEIEAAYEAAEKEQFSEYAQCTHFDGW